jgi:hypothetical protein
MDIRFTSFKKGSKGISYPVDRIRIFREIILIKALMAFLRDVMP